MGKLICGDSTASSPVIIPWLDPTSIPSSDHKNQLIFDDSNNQEKELVLWENVCGLEEQQKRHLTRIQNKGVLWKHPTKEGQQMVFKLSHGGEVESDGNCLFTSANKCFELECGARELRGRCVRRFVEDFDNVETEDETRRVIDGVIKGMYDPDLGKGWGVHVVQEVKVVVRKKDRPVLEEKIQELVKIGMQRELAAESIYKERCMAVNDGASWSKYMSVSGSPDDEYDIINMQYTEEGLLTVDENLDGRAAAFGDDIAIECLATEFKREIFVVQAHGSDAMVEEENCVFFLPHRPRSEICGPPVFLFMKGTGWCGAGADHYEPLIAQPSPPVSHEKVALVL